MNDGPKIFAAGVVLAVFFSLLLFFPGCHYSDGNRVGFVVKLSRKGIAFPTWEGQMQLGGLTQDGGSMSATAWDFSVRSDEVAATLRKAMEDGRRVQMSYVEWVARGCSYGSTGYDILEVR